MNWYLGLAVGAGAAALRVLLGWFKSGEPWETTKALRTLLIGVIEGALAGAYLAGTVAQTFAAVFLGTVVLEDLLAGTITSKIVPIDED